MVERTGFRPRRIKDKLVGVGLSVGLGLGAGAAPALVSPDVSPRAPAAIGAKDKPAKGRNGEQAEGKKKGKSQETLTVAEQIKAVSKSIEAAQSITQEEFKTWVYEEDESGLDNTIADFARPFDFPTQTYPENETGPHPYIYETADGYFTYSWAPGHKFPITEHLSLFLFEPKVGFWSSLAFYNGSVTVFLKNEQNGSATVSFGTSIWPDGKKVTYAWVSNLNVPNNPRVGQNQSMLADNPAPFFAGGKNTINFVTLVGKQQTREEFLKELASNVGQPIGVSFLGNQMLQDSPKFNEFGDWESDGLDGRIKGIETNQFLPIFYALQIAYFNQDPVAFDTAVQQGQTAEIFLPEVSSKELRNVIKAKLGKMTELDSLFSSLPFGRMLFIPDATVPNELQNTTKTLKKRS